MFAYNVSNARIAMEGELLWLVTLEDDVFVQQPGSRVSNHAMLAAQSKGKEWTKAKIMAGEPLGFGGTIQDGKITYSGLMGSEGNVPKAYDPRGSIMGASRVREAVEKVFAAAEQMGIPVDPSYGLNAVVPGRGVVPFERPLLGKMAMSGSFYNERTGQDVDFVDDGVLETYGGTEAWSVYDKATGDYYVINEQGVVSDAETGDEVGSFDAFLDPTAREPDDDRDLDWYPDWSGPTAKAAGPLKHLYRALERFCPFCDSQDLTTFGNIKHCNVCGEDWNVDAPPEAQTRTEAPPVDEAWIFSNMQKGSPYPGHHDDDKSHDKKHMKGAPEKVNEIYHACMRDNDYSQEKCAKIAWATYKDMKKSAAEIKCPECGNSDIKPDEGYEANIWQCTQCGKQDYYENFERREAAANTFEYVAAPLGIHGRTGAVMAALGLEAIVHLPENGDGESGAYTVPGQAMDIAWWGLDYVNWEENNIVVQVETDADPAEVTAIFDGLGGRQPNFEGLRDEVVQAIQSHIGGGRPAQAAKIGGPDALVCPKCGSHTLRAYDEKDDQANIKCLTCSNEFKRPLLKNPEAKWQVESMGGGRGQMTQFDVMRREVIEGLGLQRISLQENEKINQAILQAIGDTGRGTIPNKALESIAWNQIKEHSMNLIGRPHDLPADDPEVLDMWPDTIPFDDAEQDYYRNAKTAADGKFNAGQRVQIEHQSHKGQRGTIVEYQGKHDDFDEEQYKVLLDSGEELENVNESFFKKIKSANMINENLPDSTQEYSLDTMRISAPGYPLMPGETPHMEDEALLDSVAPHENDFSDEMEIANCPACDGPGTMLGVLGTRMHYRCRNCGLDFSHKEQPEVPQEVLPPELPPAPMVPSPEPQSAPAPGQPQMPMAHVSKWNDSNGAPLSAGSWYRMHHKGYKVPDVVRILNLEDNRIEAAIDTDVKGAFPIIIGDDHEYSFEPITKEAEWVNEMWLDDDPPEWEGSPEKPVVGEVAGMLRPGDIVNYSGNTATPTDPGTANENPWVYLGVGDDGLMRFEDRTSQAQHVLPSSAVNYWFAQGLMSVDAPDTIPYGEDEQEYYRSASNWRIARRKFSPAEQRALIEENPEGRARNADKLDLTGTHYEIDDADVDPDFLWGM